MYVCLLYLSSVKEHLGCFCVLAVVNSASVNTEVYVLFQISGFLFFFFFQIYTQSGISGSYGSSIFSF